MTSAAGTSTTWRPAVDDRGWPEYIRSDDIAERLRQYTTEEYPWVDETMLEAADEIERLRALIVEWDDANNFGSLHGDDLTAAVDRLNASEKALIEEARRG